MGSDDVSTNIASVSHIVREDPVGRATLRGYLRRELDSGLHQLGDPCRLHNPSGACALQWLLRGLEFFLCAMQFTFEDHDDPGRKAYEETLQPYHSWYTRLSLRTFLSLGIPGKDSICSLQVLYPEERCHVRLATIISQDVTCAVSNMLPMVRFMMDICRE